jgi:TatD DNase family protein
MLQRCKDAGVARIFLPNCDHTTIGPMLQLETDYPGQCFAMMGLHPCYVKEDFENELSIMEEWLGKRSFSAIGEIGLDFYWDKTFVPQQETAFLRQMDWALQYNRPIVIHSREATQASIDLVRQKQNGSLGGIFHCFSGTVEEAKQIVDLGFYLGIGGVVTYKNSNLGEIVRSVGLEAIVLETDAPYLAPVPYRGKRNESAYIPVVAEAIAKALDVPVEAVSEQTTRNAQKIFAPFGLVD